MKSSAVIIYIVAPKMWLQSECLAINIFRNSYQKTIETSQNSDQKRIFYAECLPAYAHEAVGSVSITTVVNEGGVSVSGFVERAF